MAKSKEQTEKIFTGIVAKGMGYAIGKNVIKAGEKCAEYFFEETSQLREELAQLKESHAVATPSPQGLAWVNIVKGDLSTLPKDEEEYLFDSDGYETGCPMWGRIAYNGKLPSLKTLDSSGEDEYHDIWEFSRWLTAPAPKTDAVELLDYVKEHWIVGTSGMWRRQTDIRDQRTSNGLLQEYSTFKQNK